MITHADVLVKTARYELHHFHDTGTVVCALIMTNGHVVVGEAHCAPDTEFSTSLGATFAKEDAIEKAKSLIAYERRNEKLKEPNHV